MKTGGKTGDDKLTRWDAKIINGPAFVKRISIMQYKVFDHKLTDFIFNDAEKINDNITHPRGIRNLEHFQLYLKKRLIRG